VSVVIPTRNRRNHLLRLLSLLAQQTCPPSEIIIVDASDQPLQEDDLPPRGQVGSIQIIPSRAHVCLQRNTGIRLARFPLVFLCDDDLEPPPDYIRRLLHIIDNEPDLGAVTGLVVEPETTGGLDTGFHRISAAGLFWSFIFQLGVWADLGSTSPRFPGMIVWRALSPYYQRLGNGLTLAGWPVLTQVKSPMFHTAVYGLGASIVRREWLLRSPYEERLDTHGIGDNYGVALGFPGDMPIGVVTDLPIIHRKTLESRLSAGDTYLRRILALHFFLCTHPRFTAVNRAFLAWSLMGHLLSSFAGVRPELRSQIIRALRIVITGRNPYLES
jgi:hypothetical protein